MLLWISQINFLYLVSTLAVCGRLRLRFEDVLDLAIAAEWHLGCGVIVLFRDLKLCSKNRQNFFAKKFKVSTWLNKPMIPSTL